MNTINSEWSPTLGRGGPVLVIPPCSVLSGSPGEHGLAVNTWVDPKGKAARGSEPMTQLLACSLLCGSSIYESNCVPEPRSTPQGINIILKSSKQKKKSHLIFFL